MFTCIKAKRKFLLLLIGGWVNYRHALEDERCASRAERVCLGLRWQGCRAERGEVDASEDVHQVRVEGCKIRTFF